MNKSELVAAVAAHTGTDPKVVAVVLNGTEDVIVATVKKGNEKVIWTGFLGFEQVARQARRGRNPATGEAIRVKAKKAPRVSVGSGFKKVVAGEIVGPKITVAKTTSTRPPRKTAPVASPSTTRRAVPATTRKAVPTRKAAPARVASKATPVTAKRTVAAKASTKTTRKGAATR